MTAITRASAKGGSKTVLRALMASCFAVTLAGCYQTEVAEKEYPTDYRQRHPIVVREGAQNVDILLGRNRGGLTPSQRADVVSFATGLAQGSGQRNHHRGSKGRPDRSRRLRCNARDPFDLCRRRRSVKRDLRAQLSSAENVARQHQAELYEVDCRCGTRAENGQRISAHHGTRDIPQTSRTGISAAPSQRNLAAMVDNPADLVQPRGEIPAYAPRRSVVLDKYAKGTNPSGAYTGYEAGKISDLGK